MKAATILSAQAARRLAWAVAISVVLLDQVSKAWVVSHLSPGMEQVLLPGLLAIQRVVNTGAAFGILSGSTPSLALMSLLVSLAVAVWISRLQRVGPWRVLGAALVLGGAFGNGLDRWRLGAVVDFLKLLPIQFPVFNVADVAINLAVLCFLIDLLQADVATSE